MNEAHFDKEIKKEELSNENIYSLDNIEYFCDQNMEMDQKDILQNNQQSMDEYNHENIEDIHALADNELTIEKKIELFEKCIENQSYKDEYKRVLSIKKLLKNTNPSDSKKSNSSKDILNQLERKLDNIDRKENISKQITFFKSVGYKYFILICFIAVSSSYITLQFGKDYSKSSIAAAKNINAESSPFFTMNSLATISFNTNDLCLTHVEHGKISGIGMFEKFTCIYKQTKVHLYLLDSNHKPSYLKKKLTKDMHNNAESFVLVNDKGTTLYMILDKKCDEITFHTLCNTIKGFTLKESF